VLDEPDSVASGEASSDSSLILNGIAIVSAYAMLTAERGDECGVGHSDGSSSPLPHFRSYGRFVRLRSDYDCFAQKTGHSLGNG
jgi:hypothetical protein